MASVENQEGKFLTAQDVLNADADLLRTYATSVKPNAERMLEESRTYLMGHGVFNLDEVNRKRYWKEVGKAGSPPQARLRHAALLLQGAMDILEGEKGSGILPRSVNPEKLHARIKPVEQDYGIQTDPPKTSGGSDTSLPPKPLAKIILHPTHPEWRGRNKPSNS